LAGRSLRPSDLFDREFFDEGYDDFDEEKDDEGETARKRKCHKIFTF
jgi:hypothetical protein